MRKLLEIAWVHITSLLTRSYQSYLFFKGLTPNYVCLLIPFNNLYTYRLYTPLGSQNLGDATTTDVYGSCFLGKIMTQLNT